MTDEEFDEIKEAVIQAKLEKFKSIFEQWSTWNDELRSHQFGRCMLVDIIIL
jgi:hypothetical protein